jgi:hypothetical protein
MSKDKATTEEPTTTTEPQATPDQQPDVNKQLTELTGRLVELQGSLTMLSDNHKALEKKLSKAQGFIKDKAEKGDTDAAKQLEEQERQRAQELIEAAERENKQLKDQLHKHTVVNEVKRVIGGKFSSSAFAQEALEARISRHASRDEKTGKIVFKDSAGNLMYRPNSMEPMTPEEFGKFLSNDMKEIALSDAVSGVRPAGQSSAASSSGAGDLEPPSGLTKEQLTEWYSKNLGKAKPPVLRAT